jgi:hypothetical protein
VLEEKWQYQERDGEKLTTPQQAKDSSGEGTGGCIAVADNTSQRIMQLIKMDLRRLAPRIRKAGIRIAEYVFSEPRLTSRGWVKR